MDYRERNRWFLTSSILKKFLENREECKGLYITESFESDQNSGMKIGTAFHRYMEVGDAGFNKEYEETKKLLKADYVEILEKLRGHPDIDGVLSGTSGPACDLF